MKTFEEEFADGTTFSAHYHIAKYWYERGQRSRDEEVEKLNGLIELPTRSTLIKQTALRCAELVESLKVFGSCDLQEAQVKRMLPQIANAIKEEFNV